VTLVSVRDLVKKYAALRPLRIEQLSVGEGELVCLVGLDAAAAEVFVGLLTGALVPDAGEIRLFEQSTADVSDSEAWLAMLDGVGIITDRAVLIEQFTIEQNIAMPFTLDVDPVDVEVKPRVEALAREVGIEEALWQVPVVRAGNEAQVRVRMARALALRPRLLLAEHPSATLPRDAVDRVGRDLARVAKSRNLAVLTLTADQAFAKALGGQLLMHEPATGALKRQGAWGRWFR
jgi:predicted ABC-type transport system involved in lysophospholipase L1 biosynthesis ATPase subunit